MIYSSACAHAIRAVSHLVAARPTRYMLIDEICDQAGISRHFVAKIFQQLVRSKLLISAKGPGGGFALSRGAEDILLLEIVDAIDGTAQFDQCVVGMAECDDRQPCPLHDEFKDLRVHMKRFLANTSLAQMSDTLSKKLGQAGKQVEIDPPE